MRITRTLTAEMTLSPDGHTVRFVEIADTDNGRELLAMVIVPEKDWRKAGSPFTATLTLDSDDTED